MKITILFHDGSTAVINDAKLWTTRGDFVVVEDQSGNRLVECEWRSVKMVQADNWVDRVEAL